MANKYNSEKHNRRSIRLKGHNYAQQGAYHVTICTQNRECILGDIKNGEMILNHYGLIARKCWNELVNHYIYIEMGMHIIMPNHIHGIINISGAPNVGAGFKPALDGRPKDNTHCLSEIIRALKTFSARQINRSRGTSGIPVWQRNYYEHIVRNETELSRINKYIMNNPIQWDNDGNNPANIK